MSECQFTWSLAESREVLGDDEVRALMGNGLEAAAAVTGVQTMGEKVKLQIGAVVGGGGAVGAAAAAAVVTTAATGGISKMGLNNRWLEGACSGGSCSQGGVASIVVVSESR